MKHLYWIGVNESEIEYCKDLFEKSITINGSNLGENISYSGIYNERVNYNLNNTNINDFFKNTLENICNNDPKAKFMFYNPYNAYICGEEIVKRTICLNNRELLELLKSKIQSKNYIKKNTDVNVLPYFILKGKDLSLGAEMDLFDNSFKEFVVQENYSDGGVSTFVLNNESDIKFKPNDDYIISPYIKNSISINVNIVIYDNDIDVFPPSVQIVINENNNLLYKGADFILYNEISSNIKNKVYDSSIEIAKLLQLDGYRGICGIDFITDSKSVYFMEINERFQASTYLINAALYDNEKESVQKMCIDAFEHNTVSTNNFNLPIPYSNFVYQKNYSDDKINTFLEKICKEESVHKIVLDGFSKKSNIEYDAYLYKTVFKNKISDISPDYTLNMNCNIKGLFNIDIANKLDIKIALLCHGIVISNYTREKILKEGGTCESINRGINITIFDDMTVNCITNNAKWVSLSPFEVVFSNNRYMLTYFSKFVSEVKLQMRQSIMNKSTSKGNPYRAIALLALDRLGINYNSNCIYHINNIPCEFCSIYNQKQMFSLEEIYEVIDDYLRKVEFEHFLIGGPINDINTDFEKIVNISKYISSKSDKRIYLMTVPIDDRDKLTILKQAGVDEIAFNIEVFDRNIAKDIMPGKGIISLQKYLSALKKSVEIFGLNGNVRSMLVVGLEPEESLLKGIEQLASIGVSPILSPFGPAKGSKMENVIPPDMDYFKHVYLKAKEICDKYNVELGPKCNFCKNNTLAMNTY